MSKLVHHVLYETSPWHSRAALFDENYKLLLLKYHDQDRPYIEGAVILGRVRKIMKGLSVAFVDIGDVVDGFLPLKTVTKQHKKVTEGSQILVRVIRASADGKGAKLDARVAYKLPSQNLKAPVLVKPAYSPLKRLLHEAGDTPLQFWVPNDQSYQEVLKTVPEAEDRIFFVDDNAPPLLENLDEDLDNMHHPVFQLKNGGRVSIEPTAALTAIDIDSGASFGIGKEEGVVAFNLEAVPDIARLIRLLDIGGNIIIDFITMKQKTDRQKVTQLLTQTLEKTDMRYSEVFAMSRFGLVEMNREKVGSSRMVMLAHPLFVAGRIVLELLRRRATYKQPVHIKVSSEVAEFLKVRLTQEATHKLFGQIIKIESVDCPVVQWSISTPE